MNRSIRPLALVAVTAATSLALAATAWWIVDGSRPAPQLTPQHSFLGKLSPHQLLNANPAYVCITPDVSADAGLASGKDWCGQVYPSEGLHIASLTTGLPVRVYELAARATIVLTKIPPVKHQIRSALVLPASAPDPPFGAEAHIPTQLAAEAFAPHLVGLTEADAITAGNSLGFSVRTISIDGKGIWVRADFRGNRIDLTVVEGLVTKTRVG